VVLSWFNYQGGGGCNQVHFPSPQIPKMMATFLGVEFSRMIMYIVFTCVVE